MRIGVAARTWEEKGGIGVYTRNLLEALVRVDRDNEYILFYHRQTPLAIAEQYENVSQVYVPSRGKLIWDQVSVPRYARKYEVDVIYHMKFAIPLMTRRKTVMVLHGTERFFYPQFQTWSDIAFFKTVYPWYLRRASMILSDCENGRKDIMELLGINGEKIKTIHLAGDPAFHVINDSATLDRIREKYRLPERFLIFVGHVYPGKNIGRLLRALVEVRKVQDVHLVIVGTRKRKYKSEFALIDELGLGEYVHTTGFIPLEDLGVLYNLAEAAVLPSYYECFPAIPLDANACGCPVVASRTGGTPEAAGDAAEYVDPLDVADIAAGICRVLEDEGLRTSLIEKGFKNATRFSWNRAARETLTALEWLGGKKREQTQSGMAETSR